MENQDSFTITVADDGRVPLEAVRLVVIAGEDEGQQLLLQRGSYLVGKSATCDLVLTDRGVSRRHLSFTLRPDGVFVKDLGSKNGSFYHGSRFAEIVAAPGATVKIGETVLLLLSIHQMVPEVSNAHHFGGLIGRTLEMRQLYAVLERVANSPEPILMEGERGTGKTLAARALHEKSARASQPFVACNLATMATTIVPNEIDLALAQAGNGTLVLEEVGDLAPRHQEWLLAKIESGIISARLVATTRRDLSELAFSTALLARLAVLRVRLPALRERKGDLPHLLKHLIGERKVHPSTEVMSLFREYDWPGNVRELETIVRRGLALTGEGEPLTPRLLGIADASPPKGARRVKAAKENFHSVKEQLIADWERSYLMELLLRVAGNLTLAAREAGLDRAYLYRLLKKHDLGKKRDFE
jgi:DNA-binding NtrC family response regulator